MEPITIIEGTALPLDRSDVDTDQIIPAQYLKRVERTGFGPFLFDEWRKDPGFVMNDPRYEGASILLAGPNFGCGSSREHAPWAIEDAGFKAVIAPSFADIFRNNCTKIGLLPVELREESVRALMDAVLDDPTTRIVVDLDGLIVRAPGLDEVFDMEPLHALAPARGPRRHRSEPAERGEDHRVRGRAALVPADGVASLAVPSRATQTGAMSRRGGDRRLAAVLFTDIVSSTEVASEMGDARWLVLLGRHHRIVRAHLKLYGGHEQDTAGDGFFATFDVPADAVRCAVSAQREVRELGIEIRAGVNFGEVEMVDGKPGGLAVHTGARIMSASSGGVVTVSSSVKELLAGAGIGFEDAGMHHLKGLEEETHLYRVTWIDDKPVAPPEPDQAEARARRDLIVDPGPARRRTALVVGAVFGALVLAGALAFSAARSGSDPATAPTGPPSNALVALDPTTGDQGQVIPIEVQPQTPFFPRGAAGQGGVWLGRDVNLLHVDPEHEEVEAVNLDTTGALNVDTGFGRVWVTVYGVSTVNVGTNEVRTYTRTERGGIGSGFVGIESDLVAAEGAVWVTVTDGRLLRIDPNDPRATQLTKSPTGELDGLDVEADGVWTFDTYDGSIIRFDPETLEADEPIRVSGGVDEIALAGGSVWVLDRSAGTVFPLGSSNSTQVGENPTVMSAGFDALWIGDEDGSVYRVDPLTGDATVVYRAGGIVNALIPDRDGEVLWLDVGAPTT